VVAATGNGRIATTRLDGNREESVNTRKSGWLAGVLVTLLVLAWPSDVRAFMAAGEFLLVYERNDAREPNQRVCARIVKVR
jgi:hypothetical protein